LTTGFLGVGHLCPALTKTGHLETAYKLLLKETFPSWGYSIANGATTIWERWDGWTAEKGFQDPAMNSFNHYSLGSIGQWLYQTVAGIDTLEPGFSHLLIAPQPGGGLTWVRAAYQSVRGRIESEWQLDGARFNLRVSVPANVTATVRLPYPIDYDPEHMFRFRLEDGLPVFEIGSGHQEFNARFKPIEVVA
jgi:alpha-L-rhamnosidase